MSTFTKLYLHAGTHKTGTTALQAFASLNRWELLERGFFYPDYDPLQLDIKDGHHELAHSIAETESCRLKREEIAVLVSHWSSLAINKNATIMISSEAMYRHGYGSGSYKERREQYIENLSVTLGNFDTEVVLVFRRPDNYLRSLYQEAVSKLTKPLPDFPAWRMINRSRGLDYYENARMFSKFFPKVKCLIYEDLLLPGGFYNNFFKEVGADVSELPDSDVVRKSLNVPQTLVKNYANNFIKTPRQGRAFIRWLTTDDVSKKIYDSFGGKDYDLWESYTDRHEFLQSRNKDLTKLRDHFFRERESFLFPELCREDVLPAVPDIPSNIKRLVEDYF